VFRSFRVPEKLFAVAMWAISIAFASFLIGLGGKIVAELPGVDQTLTQSSFIDPARLALLRVSRDSLDKVQRTTQDARERAAQQLAISQNAYASQRESFTAWIATRTATTDPSQDPEVVTRTRTLDLLKSAERTAESTVEALDTILLSAQQALDANRETVDQLELSVRDQYQRATFVRELQVFGIRLALTLPLLLLAGWLVARKRHNEYWPLYRGFVLFAVFAFFVELVPYLPSYGGYVRYGVGIIGSVVAGVFVIRAMRRYLAQRQRVEQQTDVERRQSLSYEDALKRIAAGVCPGCERTIAGGANAPSNFCVHCGLRLYDECGRCHTRKNAFFPYCPTCGVSASSPTVHDATHAPPSVPLPAIS